MTGVQTCALPIYIGDLNCNVVSKLPEKNTFMSYIMNPMEISVGTMMFSYKLKMNVVKANECYDDVFDTMEIYKRITLFLDMYSKRVKMSDVGEWLSFSTRIDYDAENFVKICYNDYGIQSYVDFLVLLGQKRTCDNNVKLQADDEIQFAYMFNYLKDLSLRHYWDFDKLFYDIMTQDPQTMDDWKQSKKVLQEVIKSL